MDANKVENLLDAGKRLEDLADDNLRQIFGELSVIDRLHLERVLRHFNAKVWELGWSGQKKLDRNIVFEGVSEENFQRFSQIFWEDPPLGEGSCHLVLLFHRVRENLLELDLASFGDFWDPEIVESFHLLPKFEKLNIGRRNLNYFLDHLPPTLRLLKSTCQISVESLEKLSNKCPNLEYVPFFYVNNCNEEILKRFLFKFPRQKKLIFGGGRNYIIGNECLASIGQLKELQILAFRSTCVDEQSFEAMVKGCQSIRKLIIGFRDPLSESVLLHLSKLPNLTVLAIVDHGRANRTQKITDDSELNGIEKREQLMKLKKWHVGEINDASIISLIDRCTITDRTFDAVLAKVHRRHGKPPRSLPSGPRDKGIFYFKSMATGIDMVRAYELAAQTPWLDIKEDIINTREII